MKSLKSLCHNAGLTLVGALTLAAASTASQTQKAAAINLNFNDPVQANDITAVSPSTTNPAGLGPGFSGRIINYRNVASGVDAKITATTFGTGYSFEAHLPNYSSITAGEPIGDAGFRYLKNGGTGLGGMTYKIDFFTTDGTTHNFTTAYTAPALRLLAYDVDGEASQGEYVRIAKGTGLVGYQVGSSAASLIATEEPNSYFFAGRDTNQPETDPSGAAIFYYENVNSVTLQFEANTRQDLGVNGVFSAIDGDLSLLAGNLSGFNTRVDTSSTAVGSTAVPEPFTIVGTLIGGTAALRMRKKIKATTKI